MSFKVQVGPPQIAIHQGQTVLVCAPDGQINWPSDRGLYFLDTRLISAWAVYANGEPWELLNGGAVTYYAARIFLTNRGFPTEDGVVPARSLDFMLSRSIGGGMHEDSTSPITDASASVSTWKSPSVPISPTSSR